VRSTKLQRRTYYTTSKTSAILMDNIMWKLLTALALCYAENYTTDPPLSSGKENFSSNSSLITKAMKSSYLLKPF
jgi:hypothetical protein